MAGQGITVSIQAKIEGWQSQIKEIQNAMKNIKPGTEISKSLMRDLQQVETLVNNLGKNMTQRLTSDSQIMHFIDRMTDVEHIFDRLGSSMQTISFGDLNPEYITTNFKELLATLEQANTALSVGMQTSFQGAIADSKALQKEFERMKLDPKDMNIDQVREALSARGKSLAKEMQDAQAETDKLKQKMDEARAARDALQDRKTFIGDDPNAKALEILGGNLPTNGTILDQKQIEEKIQTIRSSFMQMGFTEAELSKILPSIDKLMQAARWDEIPQKLSQYIRDASTKTETRLQFAQERFNATKVNYSQSTGTQNRISALVYGNNQAQEALNTYISQIVQQETAQLRAQVEQLKAQLEGKATAGVHNTGKGISNASAQGLQDAAAAADQYSAALERVKAGEQMVGKIQGVIQRWFSVYAVVRMVTNAIKKAAKNIQELDATMTEIAIVTKMDQGDLWAQMPKYTKMAREYASSIKGVYEVSQIYYQQGLEMNDVMSLTESTLKMARISGLGYSEAADYMTNAIRSFKMEMTDAERVVDVYSAVAASSASNVTELATAMSKTASSAQAVGSSFENTTAMLAVMIEATRESPENIGSAMKSIISRYGELKENKTGIDEEGEEYSLNKVDKALQTVGISIHDAKGEFRDFDDVIFELSEHWNEIDKNTQRYIATVMAGNRQQSRFLALVSSSERLKEESAKATNSEDAAQLQFLKSLDSIDAKKQQLETSIQSIYTNSGIEQVYKDILDFTNNILISFDNLSSSSGLGVAIGKIGATFMTLATLVTNAFALVKARMAAAGAEIAAQAEENNAKLLASKAKQIATEKAMDEERAANTIKTEEQIAAERKAIQAREAADTLKRQATFKMKKVGIGMIASTLGLTASTYASSLDINKDRGTKVGMTALGGILSGVGTGLMLGGAAGAIMGILTALPNVIEALGMISETTEEKVSRLEKNIENTNDERIKSKDDLNSLVSYKKKYDELYKSQYESTEKQKEFKELQNEIAEKYPSLITSMDAEGNYLVDMSHAYEELTKAKRELYSTKFVENLGAELAGLQDIDYVLKNIYGITPSKSKTFLRLDVDGMDKANQNFLKSFKEADKHKDELVPRKFVGTNDYGLPIYQYDSGFASFNANGLASLFLNQDASILSEGSDDSRATAKYLLAGLYNTYIKEAMNGTAYENINIEQIKQDLMTAAKAEFSGTYTDINANSEKYNDMLTEATTNFTSKQYKAMMTTYEASEFSKTLRQNAIQASNADYIKTLNASYESALENPLNSLTQFAMKKQLDQGLDKYLQENEYKVKEGKWYTDDKNVKHKYTTEQLVSEFYSDKQGDWYRKESQSYNFLNNDELQAQYESLGSKTRKSIIENLSENIGQTEVEAYQKIDQWLVENSSALFGTDEEITQAIEQFQRDNNLTGLSTERIRQMAITLKVFQDAWDEQYEQIYKRYDSWADALGKSEKEGENPQLSKDVAEKIQSLKDIFGPEYLQGIQEQYKTILKNESLSNIQVEEQVTGLTNILNAISDLSPDMTNIALQKIQSADLTSINGIYSFIETLKNTDLDLSGEGSLLQKELIALGQMLKVNVGAEIHSYFSEIESTAEGFDKALSSAINGMDLKTAEEMADKLGIELNNFDVREGKFFFNDIEKIKQTYIKDTQTREQALKDNLEEQYQKLAFFDVFYSNGTPDIFGEDILNGEYELESLKEEEFKKKFEENINIDYKQFLDYYEKFLKYKEKGGTENLVKFILSEVDKDIEGSSEKLAQWLTQTQALSELKNGKFNDFLTTALSGQDKYAVKDVSQQILDAAMSGDFTTLEPDLYKLIEPYIESLINFFKESKTSVVDSLIGMIGTDADRTIKVTEANKDYLQQLEKQGLVKLNGTNWDAANATVESLAKESSQLQSEILKTYKNEKDRIEAFKTLHKNEYSKNKISALEAITDSEIAYDEFLDYLTTNLGIKTEQLFAEGGEDLLWGLEEDYGLSMTAAGNYVVTDWIKYIKQLTTDLDSLLQGGIMPNGQEATIQDINRARAAVETAKQGQQTAIQQAAKDILDNYNDISIEQREALANALGIDSADELLDVYKKGLDGKTKLDVGKFKTLSAGFSSEIQEALAEQFASIIDDHLNNIKDATSMVTSGTTTVADMQDFISKYNELNPSEIIDLSVFSYDTELNQFILDSTILQKYTNLQRQALEQLGMSGEAINEYIKDQTLSIIQSNMDIDSFINATTSKDKIQAASSLGQVIKDWYGTQGGIIADETVENILHIIDNGGEEAIKWLKYFKGEDNVTSEEIQTLSTLTMTRLRDAESALTSDIGSIITGPVVAIMEAANFGLNKLEDGSAVITSVGNMVEAYANLYQQMAADSNKTTTDLNRVYAEMLTAADQKNVDALDTLQNASGIAYDAFATLLSSYNIDFKEVWENKDQWAITSDGFGKIIINSWETFVQQMNSQGANWNVDSPEYMKIYSEWVDSRAELANMPSTLLQNAAEELNALIEAKPEQAINVSYLQKAMDGQLEAWIEQYGEQYGVQLNEGLLTISNTTKIPDLVASIASVAAEAGAILPEELASLVDAVADLLSQITSLINNGISGSLSNQEALQLQNWINSYQKNGEELQLQFVQTADGLKLAESSAVALYNQLKQIDGLQAQLVFKELNESLKNTNDNYKSITNVMARIKTLSNEIDTLTSTRSSLNEIDQKRTDAKIKQYSEELALAKEILAVRSTQEDESFNFMSNKIPAAQNNPLNYAKNLTQAFQTFRDAFNTSNVKKNGKAGFMDYEDWYNIVTEFNNMAAVTGKEIKLGSLTLKGDLKSASNAIQAGASALTTVDTGELKVNLTSVGIGIQSGAEALTSGVNEGIKGVAEAQVKALDGLIAMLELIVSMEALGDIDVDGNGIDLGELFTVTYDDNGNQVKQFNAAYDKWRNDMIEQLRLKEGDEGFNKDLQAALKGITVGDVSLAEIINWDEAKFSDAEEATQKAYLAILTAFSKAAQSGNYDLDDIYTSVLSVLQESGLTDTITLDIGDMTLLITGGSISQIDWKTSNSQEVMNKVRNSIKDGKDKTDSEIHKIITDAMTKYQNGEAMTSDEIEWTLQMNNRISVKDGQATITWNGNSYTKGDTNKAFEAVMAAWRLKDAGVDIQRDLTEQEKDSGIIETTTTIGSHTNIHVRSDGTTITYTSDYTHEEYSTPQELLSGEYQYYSDTVDRAHAQGMPEYAKKQTYEEWLWVNYNIRVQTTSKITDANGNTYDPNNDPVVRENVKSKLDEVKDGLTLQLNKEGNLDLTLDNGMTLTLSGDVVVDETGAPNKEKVVAEIQKMLGLDTALQENITAGIQGAIPSLVEGLNSIDAKGPQEAAKALGEMVSNLQQLQGIGYEAIAQGLSKVSGALSAANNEQNGEAGAKTPKAVFDLSDLFAGISVEPIQNIIDTLNKITTAPIDDVASAVKAVGSQADALRGKAASIAGALSGVKLQGLSTEGRVNITVQVSRGSVGFGGGKVKGNIALAGGTRTLVGELGPELVVSQGKYYVVGQNGAEFVDLEKDAIVFNHQQTARLFANGGIGSRGIPFTNETNAISFAKGTGPAKSIGGQKPLTWGKDWGYTYQLSVSQGSVSGHLMNVPIAKMTVPASAAKGTGPAAASASAALAALKQLRAQWQALAGLSAKDLAGKGGGGGGGGGDPKAFLKDLERWYDWLQQIAQLEKEITLEEAKRTKYQNDMIARGKEYYTSQVQSLKKLQEQLITQQSLTNSQEEYFEKRRKELNEQSAFSALYGFSESGQLYYKDVYANSKSAFEWLSDLAGRNETTGEANYTAQEQYEKLIAAGFGFAMEYDSSGNKIKKEGNDWYNTAVQAFWDKIDADKEEMQSLHDSVEDGYKQIYDLQNEQNGILHEIEDNQISVEQKVLKALEDHEQRRIDDAKEERDIIEKSANDLIDGLNTQLQNERDMYDSQDEADELEKLQRQLAIAQRSGGSAATIADLQEQISNKQRDIYFDTQQKQIDALQEASNNELERLDHQIDLMQETLDYQKENGLLWNQVAEILRGSPNEIAQYIKDNTIEYWGQSTTELAKTLREDLFEIERFKQFQETADASFDVLSKIYGTTEEGKAEKKKQEQASAETSATESGTGTTNDSTTGGTTRRPGKSKASNAAVSAAAGVLAGASIASYKNTSAFTGAADGSDLLYYQTEDGRIGIVRGTDSKQAAYHLDELESTIGSKIIGVTSNFGQLPAALAAQKAGKSLLTESLFTSQDGNQEKALTQEIKKLSDDYLNSDEYKNETYKLSAHWEGKGAKGVVLDADSAKTALNSDQVKEVYKDSNVSTNGNYINQNKILTTKEGKKHPGEAVPGKAGYVYDNSGKHILKKTWDQLNKNKKARGGYVGHGIYELGELGTETVLNASQTKILRDNILSNRPDSLISLLKSYNEAYHGLSQATYDSIADNSNITTIERAEVNLQIEKLADDYDSKRAANTIMDEMLRIASKTSANNSVRR